MASTAKAALPAAQLPGAPMRAPRMGAAEPLIVSANPAGQLHAAAPAFLTQGLAAPGPLAVVGLTAGVDSSMEGDHEVGDIVSTPS
jgi:hypothetical protein